MEREDACWVSLEYRAHREASRLNAGSEEIHCDVNTGGLSVDFVVFFVLCCRGGLLGAMGLRECVNSRVPEPFSDRVQVFACLLCV